MITFLAHRDPANVMTVWSNAISQHTPYTARVIAREPNRYHYPLPHDYDKTTNATVPSWVTHHIANSRLIVIEDNLIHHVTCHYPHTRSHAKHQLHYVLSHLFGIRVSRAPHIDRVYIAIWHPGSLFRERYRHFDYRGYRFIVTAPDLYRLSTAKAMTHCFYPVIPPIHPDLEEVSRAQRVRDRIVLHLPSNPQLKGTSVVREVVSRFVDRHPEWQFYTATGVSNNEVHQLMSKSLVYIDQFSTSNGMRTCFGVSSFEALGYGNITLSSLFLDEATRGQLNQNLVEATLPIIDIGGDVSTFEAQLEHLAQLTDPELTELADNSCQKAYQLASNTSFARKFVKELGVTLAGLTPVPGDVRDVQQ